MSYYYHRKPYTRLKNYNYSGNGYYFITICTQYRLNLFGEIKDNQVVLNTAGKMINNWYLNIKRKFKEIALDKYVIMPNHIHGIIIINSTKDEISLFRIIQWFKTMTTNEYIRGVRSKTYKPFEKRLWQESYYDHIIHNKENYLRIQKYIMDNPILWNKDCFNK
ncbi:MAG: transposase [Firmicutes bacterium]|nr:transposase [Bacillota bacterium]